MRKASRKIGGRGEKMTDSKTRSIRRVWSIGPLLAAFMIMTLQAPAQTVPASRAGVAAKEAESATMVPALPESLTRQTIRDVLSGLNDAQARELLIRELDRRAAMQEEARAAGDRPLVRVLNEWAAALSLSWASAVEGTPALPGVAIAAFEGFQARRGDAGLWRLSGTVLLCLLAGAATALGIRRLMRRWENRLYGLRPAGLRSQVGIIAARFLVQALRLIAFLVAAQAVDGIVNRSAPADSTVAGFVIGTLGWAWFAIMAARFVLSPARAHLRLTAIDDETAWLLTWSIGLIFGWSAFSAGLLQLVNEFGSVPGDGSLGFWLSAIYHGLIALTLWRARTGIVRMVLGRGDSGLAWRRFASAWPMIAIALILLQWLIVELFAATGNLDELSVTALNVSTAILLALPLIELAIGRLVEAVWPEDTEQEPSLRAAHKETQSGLVRCARIVVVVAALLFLTRLWGLDLRDLASQGVGAQFAGAMIEVLVIGLIAYGLWELLEIMADRQVAIERATLGIGDEAEEPMEGEGGRGGTRLGTVMPLLRRTGQAIIAGLALLAILGQVGVNVTPLLAGAGVIGLAVGFGAQALVRDILSGVFFLIDDAFRQGEYIDIGSVKGTVEKISIRSMQLRHQNGPLNTIPFGEIRHLTNYSRDWVLMKLPLRVTYDTDVEKVRKSIKKLGQELMQDPELGPKFLQPLKSQGVIQMEDSAMIIRVKFMTRPGDQWILRNRVFARIRELFELEGIKFAHREVTVRIADPGTAPSLSGAGNEAAAAAAAARVAVESDEAGTEHRR